MPFPLAALGLGLGSLASGALAHKTQKSGKVVQSPTMSQSQISRAEQAGQQGLNQINNPYQGFEPIAQQATNNFYQNTVPTLANRFTSLTRSGGGAISSPAFASQLGAAGAGLNSDLAAMQSQYGQQQQQLGQGLLRFGQQPQFENNYIPGGPSFLSERLGALSNGLAGSSQSGFQNYFNNYFNDINNNNPNNPSPNNPSSRFGVPFNRPSPNNGELPLEDNPMPMQQMQPYGQNMGQQPTQQQQGPIGIQTLQSKNIGSGGQQGLPYKNVMGNFLNQQYGNQTFGR